MQIKGNRNNQSFKFDIIAHNGNEIVIEEVKTTLRVKYVSNFIDKLIQAKEFLPDYEKYTIYGAIAYLREEEASASYAENSKLFVIRATRDSAIITNKSDFIPRAF